MLLVFLGANVTKAADGSGVVDPFARAKDIFSLILPLVSSALGYWFGVQGKDKAEARADDATKTLTGVALVSTDPDLINKARDAYPGILGPTATGSGH